MWFRRMLLCLQSSRAIESAFPAREPAIIILVSLAIKTKPRPQGIESSLQPLHVECLDFGVIGWEHIFLMWDWELITKSFVIWRACWNKVYQFVWFLLKTTSHLAFKRTQAQEAIRFFKEWFPIHHDCQPHQRNQLITFYYQVTKTHNAL